MTESFTTENGDETAPTVTITSAEAALTATSPFTITITFDEVVTGFELTDITVTNGSASNLQETTTGKVFTASITPNSDPITVTATIAAGTAADSSSNENTASNTFSIVYDTSALTVATTSDVDDPTNDTTFEATITFSEEVTGFELADITVTNGTASNLVSSSNPIFTATITPTADGDVSVDVSAGVATDETTEEKSNTAASTFSTTYDGTAPTVDTITPADESTDQELIPEIIVTFNEAMDTATVTTNTADTTCSGTLQVSDDDFTTCVQMDGVPTISGEDKSFEITPNATLDSLTIYKVRVTTGVSDVVGNNIAATDTQATGFETAGPIYMFDNGAVSTGNLGSRSTTTTTCTTRKNNDYAGLACTNIAALISYTDDDIASMLDNHDFVDNIVQGPTATKVVDNWADLLDGSFDEDLVTANVTAVTVVWTGSNADGTKNNNCTDWTDGTAGASGYTAQVNFPMGLYTGGSNCAWTGRFVCICQ
jgi:hypothetical protein